MKIESTDRTVDQLLRMGYFKIPRFQRAYSWEKAEVEDFWRDTVVEADSDYFIGSLVLFRYGENLYGIVDGQQRLTTITMLLCALRNKLSVHGYSEMARGLQNLIERPDIDNKNQYVLQTESSYPFLQEHIQKFDGPPKAGLTSGEEARLRNGFEYINLSLDETLESILNDKSLSTQKQKVAIKERLTDIRDCILRLKLIIVTLQDEEDAYLIFETLNTRGKDLTVSDLVRTHITRLLPQPNRNVDRAKERFNAIIESFEASQEEISINSFLHHYWLSRYEYTTEKKLYKGIKKRIHTADETKEYLNSLETDATYYRVIHEPTRGKWRIEQRCLRDALNALNLFRVRQQIPFVLSVFGEYEEGRLSLQHTRRALEAVENFHFLFTAVTSQRSSGGISLMYALHARELRGAKPREKARVINELVEKLRAKRPDYQEFEANFRGILCSEKYTKDKALVQYILGHMTNAFVPSISIDWSGMTIEHLANQGGRASSDISDEEVAEIGNLLLVSEALNSKLRNKAFSEKMRILKNAPVYRDNFLKEQTTWGAKKIRQRTDHLAKIAYDQVWKL